MVEPEFPEYGPKAKLMNYYLQEKFGVIKDII